MEHSPVTAPNIVRVLKDNQVYELAREKWTEGLKQEVIKSLSPSEQQRLIVSDTETGQHVIIRLLPRIADKPKIFYPVRSWRSKVLPVFVLAALLCVAAAVGRGLDKLVTAEFLIYSPFIMGALIAYAQNYKTPASFGKILISSLFFVVLMNLLAIFILKEGVICLIMATPVIFMALTLGAGAMHLFCRWLWKPQKTIYSLAVLPLLFMFIPEQNSDYLGHSTHSQVIDAPASVVWQQINHADHIKPIEMKPSMVYGIGVPYPVSGITRQTPEGLIRYSTWQRGVQFEELIQESQPNQYLRWTYRFKPDSFPPGALDDHIKVGGKYFDVLDTAFTLTPIDASHTQLKLEMNYRVSTEVNFYASRVANWMFNDFSKVILDFYKQRSEHAAITSNDT